MSLCVWCLVIMPVTKLSAGVADFAFRRYLSFILLNAPAGRMNNLPTADLSPTTLNHYFETIVTHDHSSCMDAMDVKTLNKHIWSEFPFTK